MNKNYLYIIIGILVLIVLFLLVKKKIDASSGGFFEGKSHENGGIPGTIKANGKRIEVEGGEVILDVNSMNIKDRFLCSGTPREIASELNQLGGSGVKFAENGKCYKVK